VLATCARSLAVTPQTDSIETVFWKTDNLGSLIGGFRQAEFPESN
jgi:hypothetical protein